MSACAVATFSLRFKMADSGQDSAPAILPVSPANTSPATHEVVNLIADKSDVVGNILPGVDSALFGLFKGKCSECLPSSAVTRGEESRALVCSSGFSPISRDSSSHNHPLTSLRSRASSGSGSPPRLSTPKRVSSCKLVPFHGKLIPLLPSEMLLLKDVANQSIFSLLAKPTRARSLSPSRLSKSTYKIPKVAPKKKPPPPPPRQLLRSRKRHQMRMRFKDSLRNPSLMSLTLTSRLMITRTLTQIMTATRNLLNVRDTTPLRQICLMTTPCSMASFRCSIHRRPKQ